MHFDVSRWVRMPAIFPQLHDDTGVFVRCCGDGWLRAVSQSEANANMLGVWQWTTPITISINLDLGLSWVDVSSSNIDAIEKDLQRATDTQISGSYRGAAFHQLATGCLALWITQIATVEGKDNYVLTKLHFISQLKTRKHTIYKCNRLLVSHF